MLKSLTFAGSGEWCVTADYLEWRLQGCIWTATFASDCVFSEADSFQFWDCVCHNQEFFNLKKNPGGRVHGWSALHGFHSLQHNSGIKKLHAERWILNNYVDSVYRDMPSLAAEVLMLCFMWLLHSIEEASWTPQQAPEIFQGPFQYPTSPLPQEVLRGMVKTEGCWGLQRKFMCFNRV